MRRLRDRVGVPNVRGWWWLSIPYRSIRWTARIMFKCFSWDSQLHEMNFIRIIRTPPYIKLGQEGRRGFLFSLSVFARILIQMKWRQTLTSRQIFIYNYTGPFISCSRWGKVCGVGPCRYNLLKEFGLQDNLPTSHTIFNIIVLLLNFFTMSAFAIVFLVITINFPWIKM